MTPPPALRLCRANMERFALPAGDWEAKGWNLECVDCLAQCGDCEAGPLAALNGDFVFADTLPELVAKLAAEASSAG